MKSVQELIIAHRQREKDCLDEKLEVIDRYNAAEFDGAVEADLRHAIAMWEEERVVARDTTAWLETLAARLNPSSHRHPDPGDAGPHRD